MNVSISQIVADLDTTIQGVQLAITLSALVMAAFMLVGAKLGDIWGRESAHLAIGLAIYRARLVDDGAQSEPRCAAHRVAAGWRASERCWSDTRHYSRSAAANYEGRDRALAYGLIGGVAAAAIAAGQLIGGWITTAYASAPGLPAKPSSWWSCCWSVGGSKLQPQGRYRRLGWT